MTQRPASLPLYLPPPCLPARSLRTHLADPRQQAMYGIVHGGMDLDLRRGSLEYLSSLPFDGFAVGGSLGKDRCGRGRGRR